MECEETSYMRKIIYRCNFCYGLWCHSFINNINIKQNKSFSFNRLLILQIVLAVSKALQGYVSLQHIENYRPSKTKYEDINNEIMKEKKPLQDMDKDCG